MAAEIRASLKKSRTSRLALASLVMISSVLAELGCGEKEQSSGGLGGRGGGGQWGGADQAAIPVKAVATVRENMFAYVQTHARLEAERSVQVIARAAGLVTELVVEEGDQVGIGDVLARLDKAQLKLRYRESQVALEQAKSTHDRTASLFSRALVSQEELDEVKRQFQEAELALEEARLNLTYADITAPIPGVIMERTVEIGDMVNLNQHLFTVADVDPLLARIRIPEQRLQELSVGQRAKIVIDSLPEREFTGKVRMINPGVDPQSGTVKVTLEIPGNEKDLRPGMFASVHIITGIHQSALVIPKQALILETDEEDVFLYNDGQAQRVRVELGYSEGDRVEVTAGLDEGDRVITIGQEGLKDGQSVRLAGEGPSGGPTGGGGALTGQESAPTGSVSETGGGEQAQGGQWGGGRSGGQGMPDSAAFVQRVQEHRGLTEEEAIRRWGEMKERMKNRSGGDSGDSGQWSGRGQGQ